VAWGRVDSFNLADSTSSLQEGGILPEERVKDFILRYINRGPEKIMPVR